MLDKVKTPPQAVDVEAVVLGTMLLTKDACLLGLSQLKESSFYKDAHVKIFKAIKELNSKNESVDIVTVAERLRFNGDLKSASGVAFIAGLTSRIASDAHFESHCLILFQKEIARAQINLGLEVVRRASDETVDVFETETYLNDKAYEISSMGSVGSDVTNLELIDQVIKQIEQASKCKGLTGIDTGFSEMNTATGGWQPTELIILAARPAMGKTALALCMMLTAIKQDKRVLFFSLEMGSEQLMKRLISIVSSVSGDDLKKGSLSMEQWGDIHQATSLLTNDNIKVIDDVFEITGIVNRAKMERLKNGVDMIVVDYLQLIDNKKKGGSREQEISEVSRKLKLLAKFLKIPIIALSQLSRAVETRGGDKRPMLSDLRESGAIEQDADIVIFLYRAQYYGFTENENGESTNGKAEAIFAKNRSGSLLNAELNFIHECTRFDDPKTLPMHETITYNPNAHIEPNLEF